MWNSLPPNVHCSFKLSKSIVAAEMSRFSNHASSTFTAFHNLLEHDKAFKLRSVNVVGQLCFPFLVTKLDSFLEYFIKALIFMSMNHEEDIVELVLDEMRAHEYRFVFGEVIPIFLLPEKLNPHFVCAGTLIAHAAWIAVSVEVRDITELLPFV